MTVYRVEKSTSALTNIKWPRITRKLYTSFNPVRAFRKMILYLHDKGINLFPNVNQLPDQYTLYAGSAWFCIPLEVAQYILHFVDENEWYYAFFKNAMCPDEWFFQTLIMNSEYKSEVVNNNLTYLRWGDTFQSRNHPVILKMDDIPSVESSDAYFARKFDEKIDQSVIRYYHDRVRFGLQELSGLICLVWI